MTCIYRDVTIAADGCAAVVAGPGIDNTAALQAHADYLSARSGGVLCLPPGYYFGTVVLRGYISLLGAGLATILETPDTRTPVKFDDVGGKAFIRDIFIVGDRSHTATQPALWVGVNRPVDIDNVHAWFGCTGLRQQGVDGHIRNNSFIWGWQCCVENYGANWWDRVKLDDTNATVNGQPWTTPFGFVCGPCLSGAGENRFSKIDISGNFGRSIFIGDSTQQFDGVFESSIFSAPVETVAGCGQWLELIGCKFGSSITHNGGFLQLSGGRALHPTVIGGGGAKGVIGTLNVS